MITVGITGLIGTGKTFALNFFKSKKIPTFSADKEVKKILGKVIIKKRIKKIFPETFLKSKKLDKNLLASIVFNNKKKLIKLEKIIHPLVKKKKKNFLYKHRKKPLIFLEIPILFETKSSKDYNYIILMTVNKKIQEKRVLKRKDMTYEKFKKILSNQSTRKKKADFLINNSGARNKTKKILEKTLNTILSTDL